MKEINFEAAAIRALAELKSMPIEALAKEVETNLHSPLSQTLINLAQMSNQLIQHTSNQSYSPASINLQYARLNEKSYREFKAANIDQYLQVAS